MRILQLIDSLEIGGAEQMAVNYANGLSAKVAFSGLVATRKGGVLRNKLKQDLFYSCLDKKFTFDFQAIWRLRTICKANQVEYIHAHGTSYFSAVLLKLIYKKVNLIWHEHAGARSEEWSIHNFVLRVLSQFFCGIVVVNRDLELWCKRKLGHKKVIYLPNFVAVTEDQKKATRLKGIDGKRIVCLANLRNPKNHKILVEAAGDLKESHPEWTFHFVGRDMKDAYSDDLKDRIKEYQLENQVFLYGACEDIDYVLGQASIGVLSSSSEGLPVAILEYGMHQLPVVVTAVGQIPEVVQDKVSGFVVEPNSVEVFGKALKTLVKNEKMRSQFGLALALQIKQGHSEAAVLRKYVDWINHNLKC